MEIKLDETEKSGGKYIIVFLIGLALGFIFSGGSLNLLPSEGVQENTNATGGTGNIASGISGGIPDQCQGKEPPKTSFCVIDLAKQKSTPSLCEKVTNEELKNYCYGYVKGIKERCEKVEDKFLRQKCMNEVK